MNFRISATLVAMATLWGSATMAQDAAPAQVETMDSSPAVASTGPEWWAFSRSPSRHYLIDINSVAKTGDELAVTIARVSTESPAGDYSHTVDRFGIRCSTGQSQVVTTAEALADGTLEEAFTTDEPWTSISSGSLDDSIRRLACEDLRPEGQSYPTVKAYIDAGRP